MLQDLITSLACEEIIPLAKYGSITCISVIENASNSKTRVIAARECRRSVEKCGLSGIGKKGIQTTARILSEEHIAENKVAYLDLIETIVSKMNGDVQKYAKICGSSNLSIKAKEMVDSRMKKVGEHSSQAPRRQSLRPKSVTRRSISTSSGLTARSIPNSVNTGDSLDEKPSLKLEIGNHAIPNSKGYEHEITVPNGDATGPFTFSFNKPAENASTGGSPSSYKGMLSEEYVTKRDATSGAAASLRERLQQIRDKNKSEREETLRFHSSQRTPSEQEHLFYSIMDDVDNLLNQPTPLGQDNKLTSIALVGLRKLHASLTAGTSQNTNTDPAVLQELRKIVKSKVSFCVEKLTR